MQWSTVLPALVCCGVCTVIPDLVYCGGLYCRLWYTVLTVLVYCGVLYTCGTGILCLLAVPVLCSVCCPNCADMHGCMG